MQFNATRIT